MNRTKLQPNPTGRRALFIALAVVALLVAAILWMMLSDNDPPAVNGGRKPGLRQLQALLHRADEASNSGDREQAKSFYRQALQIDPKNSTALLALAVYAQTDRDFTSATSLLADISREDPRTAARAFYLEGSIAVDQHRAIEAKSLFLRSIQSNPDFVPAQEEYARLLALQLMGKDLVTLMSSVSARRPIRPSEAAMRLLAGRQIIGAEAAIPALRELLKADPRDIDSAIALIRYHLSDGNTAAATEVLQQVQLPDSSPRLLQILSLAICESADGNEKTPAPTEIVFEASDLETLAGEEIWSYLWPLLTRACSDDVVLSIAKWRRANDPFSTAASNALSTALRQVGLQNEAVIEERATAHLDQIELLAYRMMRPQAQQSEMAWPVAMELADHLEAIDQRALAKEWLEIAAALQQHANQTSHEVLNRLQRLQAEQPIAELAPKRPSFDAVTLIVQKTDAIRQTTDWDFVDTAAQYQLTFRYHNGRTIYKRILETVGGGPAILDIDSDLWPDVYFAQGQLVSVASGGVPAETAIGDSVLNPATGERRLVDQVYRSIRGNTLLNVTSESGISDVEHSLAATCGDLDNDGFADLVVANAGISHVYRNNGDGTFQQGTPSSMLNERSCSSGACLADFDEDSNLDLILVNYVGDWEKRCVNGQGQFATCDPRELTAVSNRIYRNLGDGEFQDVTNSSGLSELVGRGLGIVAADLAGDEKIDVFIANDGMPNFLLRNDSTPGKIQFSDVAVVCGVAVPDSGRAHAGMGVAVDDFDQNGHADIFVTNFYREQNTLYSAVARETFVDASRQSGLGPPSVSLLGFGTQPIDVDGDGDRDIVIMNGDIDDYSASGRPWKMPVSAFSNSANGTFVDVSRSCGKDMQQPQIGRGVARVDLNGDGRDDLIAVRHDGITRLLLNQTPASSRSVAIRCVSRTGNRDSIGARLACRGDSERNLELTAGDGFSARNEAILRMPLGQTPGAACALRWPLSEDFVGFKPTDGELLVLVESPSGEIACWRVDR